MILRGLTPRDELYLVLFFSSVNAMDWVVFWSQCCLVQKYSDISLSIDPEDPDCFSLLQLGSGYRMRDHFGDLGQHR